MKRFDWEEFFQHHPIFSSLDKQEVARLIQEGVSEEKEYQKDDVILWAGEPGDTLFVIGAGAVEVVLGEEGGQEILVSILRKGDFFGDIAVIEQHERIATVRAREHCTLLEVKGREFNILLHAHTEIEFKMLRVVNQRLRRLTHTHAKKIQDIDAKLDLFNTKLDAQLKAVDTTWKATQTVFDQVNIRTNEVITSADRNWTRMTIVGTLIVGVMTALGWFGFQQVLNFRNQAEQVYKLTEQAYQSTEQARKQTEQAREQTAQNVEATTKDKNVTQEAARVVQALEPQLNATRNALAKHILLPAIRTDLLQGHSSDASHLYEVLHGLQPLTDEQYLTLLNAIEFVMLKPPSDIPTGEELHGFREGWIGLLNTMHQNIAPVYLKIRSYELLLMSLILQDGDQPDGTNAFEEKLADLKRYLEQNTIEQDKNHYINADSLSRFKEFFNQKDIKSRELFQRVIQLIPTK
jgi:CRP-like cAMP-binding protein/type II secretory pathway pseudopilin PulG